MDVKKALKQTAKQEHKGIVEIRREIELAIAEAVKDPDPRMQARWRAIPCMGEYPTPEEVICFISNKIKNDLYSNLT